MTEGKNEALQDLYQDWFKCQRCGLCKPKGAQRRNVVFGEGNPNAHIMIIGDAPDYDDDKSGIPLSGKSASIVDEFLKMLGSNRDEVFITNLVACRPISEEDPSKLREPTSEELEACYERVSKIIDIVDPYVVLILGPLALKVLANKTGLAKIARHPFLEHVDVATPGHCVTVTRPGYATYHPKYILEKWVGHGPPDELRYAYNAWQKAFVVSDMHARIYKGTSLPDRGEQ